MAALLDPVAHLVGCEVGEGDVNEGARQRVVIQPGKPVHRKQDKLLVFAVEKVAVTHSVQVVGERLVEQALAAAGVGCLVFV